MGATWPRCRMHWTRNALEHIPTGQQTAVVAGLRQAFLQAGPDDAHKDWRQMADQFHCRWPRLGKLLDEQLAQRASLHALPGPAPGHAA
jgi:putative transposase